MTTWLLCDYGEVLSRSQSPAAVAGLAALAGMPTAHFLSVYWEHRPAYDRGDVTAAEYWAAVAPGVDVASLVALDVAGWLDVDAAAVAAALGCGAALALLSNAPVEVAAGIDGLAELSPWSPRLFSCHLRRVKPEPAAFALALDALGAPARDVVFVDDRPANVAAAAALGVRAVHYTGPASWEEVRRALE